VKGLLIQSLKLCAAAGMIRLGLVALDGTKIEANAAAAANRTHATLEAQVAELLSRQRPPIGPRMLNTPPPAATSSRGRWSVGLSGWPGCSTPRRRPVRRRTARREPGRSPY
jgi:hypothetical protein